MYTKEELEKVVRKNTNRAIGLFEMHYTNPLYETFEPYKDSLNRTNIEIYLGATRFNEGKQKTINYRNYRLERACEILNLHNHETYGEISPMTYGVIYNAHNWVHFLATDVKISLHNEKNKVRIGVDYMHEYMLALMKLAGNNTNKVAEIVLHNLEKMYIERKVENKKTIAFLDVDVLKSISDSVGGGQAIDGISDMPYDMFENIFMGAKREVDAESIRNTSIFNVTGVTELFHIINKIL